MYLLLDSGIRVSELVGIEMDDVNIAEGYIKIRRAQRGKERIIPLGSVVQKSLWKYITHYRTEPLTKRIRHLFLNN